MTKALSTILTFCLFSVGYCQKMEGGIIGGTAYYIGDINPNKHFNPLKLAGGIILRKNINSRISFRGTVTYMQLQGYDSESSSDFQQGRNLHFKNNIWEVAGGVEINFINYKMGDIEKYPFSPYIFFEAAYYHMNPQAQLNGEWYELQTLGTEGQGTSLTTQKPYSLSQFAIPIGLGFRMNLTKGIALSLEYGVRKTFTDYIDDVSGNYVDSDILAQENGALAPLLADQSSGGQKLSGMQRGNGDAKDWYFFSGACLTFILGKDSPCPTW